MLNILNLVTAFKERLVSQRDIILQMLTPYITGVVDDELDLDIALDEQDFEKEISEGKWNAYYNMFNELKNHTFQLSDGVTIGVNYEYITDDTHIRHIYKDALHNDFVICELIKASEGPYISYFIKWEGWDAAKKSTLADNLSALYTGLLDAEAICTTSMTAIDLCGKGQLDPTNLAAAISNIGLNARESVREVMNTIITNVSGRSGYQQAYGLVQSLQEVYSTALPGNMVVDDDRINFHPVDYSISSAILLPLDSLIPTIAGVVGAIFSFFGQPLGFIISAASAGISGLFQMAQTSLGNDWNINVIDSIDNEACATPLYRAAVRESYVPVDVVNNIKKFGYVRFENAFFTIYGWLGELLSTDPDVYNIYLEVFPNVNIDMAYIYGVQTMNELITKITTTIVKDTHSWTLNPSTINGTKTAVSSLFDAGRSPCSEIKVQYPNDEFLCHKNAQNRFITWSMVTQFAFMAFRALNVVNNYEHHTQNDTIVGLEWLHTTDDPSEWDESDCQRILADYLVWFTSLIDAGNDTWAKAMTNEAWPNISAGLINAVFKAILRLHVVATDYNEKMATDIFGIFSDSISMGDPSVTRDLLGQGMKWSPSPCLLYATDFMVSPPKNRFNFATRLITTALVAASIATVTAITTAKLKKRVAYKSMEKQKELTNLRDTYQKTGSFDDFNALYRATKKYNRTYGLLTGTSFDMTNSWYNSTKNTGTFSSVSDVFPSMVQEDETTGKTSIDLSAVINLIK